MQTMVITLGSRDYTSIVSQNSLPRRIYASPVLRIILQRSSLNSSIFQRARYVCAVYFDVARDRKKCSLQLRINWDVEIHISE